MANKEYKVRVQNKYDTIENWLSSELILGKGEFGIAEVTNSDGTKGYVVKSGDGVHKWADLVIPDNYVAGEGIDIKTTDKGTQEISATLPVRSLTQAEYDALPESEKMASVLYIITDGESEPLATVPDGTIFAWYGSLDNIPYGYALCDGNNGTPNLIGKFIVGAAEGMQSDESMIAEFSGVVGDDDTVNLRDNANIQSDVLDVTSEALYYIMKMRKNVDYSIATTEISPWTSSTSTIKPVGNVQDEKKNDVVVDSVTSNSVSSSNNNITIVSPTVDVNEVVNKFNEENDMNVTVTIPGTVASATSAGSFASFGSVASTATTSFGSVATTASGTNFKLSE